MKVEYPSHPIVRMKPTFDKTRKRQAQSSRQYTSVSNPKSMTPASTLNNSRWRNVNAAFLWRALQRHWVGANGAGERLPTLRSCAARIACIFHANRSSAAFPLWLVLNVLLRKCSVPTTTNRMCNTLSGHPGQARRQPGRIYDKMTR